MMDEQPPGVQSTENTTLPPEPPLSVNSGEIVVPATGRAYYEDYISKVLDRALDSKNSLEQRGITVVTTSGALVTLVFTVVSFVLSHVGSNAINPHAIIRGSIELAALLFVVAAFLGLAINLPVPYGAPNPQDLAGFLYNESLTEGEPSLGAQTQSKEQFTKERESELRSGSRFLTDSTDAASWEVALSRVKLLRKAKKWNQLKALALLCAVSSEVVAIGSLAWGIHKLLGL